MSDSAIPEPAGFAGKILGASVLAILLLLGLKYFSSDDSSPPDETAAVEMAQKFVLDKLVSPGTAKFSGSSETRAYKDEQNKWHVIGWVDSQNRAGGLIRSQYRVTLWLEGETTWRASEVRVSER